MAAYRNPGLNIPAPAGRVVTELRMPEHRHWYSKSERMMLRAVEDASRSGHDMAPPERDAPNGDSMLSAGWISYCRKCDGYLVVDLIESKRPYGRAWERSCPGRPPVPPALRREVSMARPAVKTWEMPEFVITWTKEEHEYVSVTCPDDSWEVLRK